MGIDYYNNSSTSIQQQYAHDIVHRIFYLRHFRHYYAAVTTATAAAVVVLALTYRYNAVRGRRTGSNNNSPSVQHARSITRLLLDETHARGA